MAPIGSKPSEKLKQRQFWQQRQLDLIERKRDIERYFVAVDELGELPHFSNAVALWREYNEHGNYPFAGGYFNQPAAWRDDMVYVSAAIEYAALPDQIDEANDRLKD